jgi:hypothetical protein
MWPNRLEDTCHSINYAADTVLLARQWNINSILKRALYELVISEGFKESETDQIDPDVDGGGNQPVLTVSDFSLLLHTREQLTTFWMRKAIRPPQPTVCKSAQHSPAYQACAVTRVTAHRLYKLLLHDSNMFERYRYNPIQGLDIICNAPWVQGEVWPTSIQPREGLLLPIDKVGYLCSPCAKQWRAM